jgi:putative aldouronate transport system permease protein
MKTRLSASDRVFTAVNLAVLLLWTLAVVYPLIYVLSASFSDPAAVDSGAVRFLPIRPTLIGYQAVFQYPQILVGYANSLFYAVAGMAVNVVMTILGAYPLSRREFKPRGFVMGLFVVTMLFSGGLIPTYLVIRSLGMVDTRWAIIVPAAMSVWNVVLMTNYFKTSVPNELHESADMDGCGEFRYLRSILVPLSKPIIAVVALFSAVGFWNSYFSALIYLSRASLIPLQLVLRDILILNTFDLSLMMDVKEAMAKQQLSSLLRYSLIVVASIPVLILYPFAQKHFVKGIMVGSLKG